MRANRCLLRNTIVWLLKVLLQSNCVLATGIAFVIARTVFVTDRLLVFLELEPVCIVFVVMDIDVVTKTLQLH